MARRRRGYPVAILIGLEKNKAILWNIFSETIKPDITIMKKINDYNFYEAIVDSLRPNIKQGLKTVLVASTDKKNYEGLYEHIEKHQRWLIVGYELNRVSIKYVEGSARELEAVVDLVEKKIFQKTIKQASYEDIKRVLSILEKRLNSVEGIDTLCFTLYEVENAVYNENSSSEYILMTKDFQLNHRRRANRLIQISHNKGIKAMIVDTQTPIGTRLNQFGGLICMMKRF